MVIFTYNLKTDKMFVKLNESIINLDLVKLLVAMLRKRIMGSLLQTNIGERKASLWRLELKRILSRWFLMEKIGSDG